MPSGAVHAVTGALLLGGGLVAVAYDVAPVELAVGLAGGILLTPDIDIDHRTREEAMLWKVPLVGWAWQCIWAPYAFAVPHRSPLSHWPVVGTMGRAAYLAFWVWVAQSMAGRDWLAVITAWPGLWWAMAGWAVQDGLHWALDNLFRGRRRG